jgi:hypothetical protein
MNDIVSTSKIPNLFKRAKVISIIKPGKDGTDPAHYRPISLLSVIYKLLKRLILQRIQPLIEDVTPINQAGFRQHRSCTERVMALTTHIEAGFQHQLKTGAVFIDLTAAFSVRYILERRSDDKIFGSCSLPKAIQFAKQHADESLLPGFSWRPK